MPSGEFEWDSAKARANLAKHGVSFESAHLVFDDAFALELVDVVSDPGETRYVITGMAKGVLLTVVYTERDTRTRLLSARKATRHEQRAYYDSQTSG